MFDKPKKVINEFTEKRCIAVKFYINLNNKICIFNNNVLIRGIGSLYITFFKKVLQLENLNTDTQKNQANLF